ncbi:putative Survival protein SurE-like phosphatase/nucleotidase domain-containing protein [Seiridium cardinale]
MHILVTNDDGPPSPTSSPYVHSLVRALQKAGHTVSVCLPASQRSWIGKAHMIGQTVKPTYYRPPPVFDPRTSASDLQQGSIHTRPSKSRDVEEWILADGTPASCAQLGLYHFFTHKEPIDLVVSGPNYGRNTTAVFGLSSGTLGAALEAAVCRRKSIALSYAFFRDQNDPHLPDIVEQGAAHSVRVIEKLYEQWPTDKSVDLYTVNVPLVDGVGKNKVLFTEMLANYWAEGRACFQEVEASVADEDEEERIREAEGREGAEKAEKRAVDEKDTSYPHRNYKWAPQKMIADVNQSILDAKPGNDGWAVMQGYTSITPMKANFWHAAPELHGQELKLGSDEPAISATEQGATLSHRTKDHFYALIDYEDSYVQPLILSAFKKAFPELRYTLLTPPTCTDASHSEITLSKLLPAADSRILQITPYESIDWDFAASHESSCFVNSYMLRKALIRKHYLSSTIENWVAKRPDSILKTHVKRGEAFELDYAEFLDDALVEAFELRATLDNNEEESEDGAQKGKESREWWILKPGMSDRGQGIRLFSTMEDLQGIFEEWEEGMPDSDDEEDEDEDGPRESSAIPSRGQDDEDEGDGIMTSHLRHFVAQPYIHPPLLLPGSGNRKFHIRTYVLCVGSLDVYVYRDMLALFAGKPYVAPWEQGGDDLEAHLTNTCLQRSVSDGTVRKFWDLDMPSTSTSHEKEESPSKEGIFKQICEITGDVFEAAARGMMMHFQPLPNAFEVYGLDFLVDADGTAWLLEVNAFPDFKQTGDELKQLVEGLWEGVMGIAVGRFFGVKGAEAGKEANGEARDERLVHVRKVDLGRRWGS